MIKVNCRNYVRVIFRPLPSNHSISSIRINIPHGIIHTVIVRARVIVFLTQRVHLSPLQAVGEVHPGPEVVGIEAGSPVKLLPAVLVGLEAGIRRLPHHTAEGIVVRHLLHGAVMSHHHAVVAEVVAEVEVVGGRICLQVEGDVSVLKEQPPLSAVVDHVSAVVHAAQLVSWGYRFHGVRPGGFAGKDRASGVSRCERPEAGLHAILCPQLLSVRSVCILNVAVVAELYHRGKVERVVSDAGNAPVEVLRHVAVVVVLILHTLACFVGEVKCPGVAVPRRDAVYDVHEAVAVIFQPQAVGGRRRLRRAAHRVRTLAVYPGRVSHVVVGGPPVVNGVVGAERGALSVVSRREAVQPVVHQAVAPLPGLSGRLPCEGRHGAVPTVAVGA